MKIENTQQLRSFLIDRMVGVASGKEPIARTNSVSRIASQITGTLALELKAAQMIAENEARNNPLKLT